MSDVHSGTDAVLMGMGIEDVSGDDGAIRVITPGAIVAIGKDCLLQIHQRIGVERELLSLRLHEHFAPWRIAKRTAFRCVLAGNGLTITVQGDSLVIFTPQQNMKLRFGVHFSPEYSEEVRGNRLALDKQGGFGVFGFPSRPTEFGTPGSTPQELACHLARRDELWISISPPRRQDPGRLFESISHDIMYNLQDDKDLVERYPTSGTLEDIAEHCHILALHEEVWRDAPDWVDDPPGSHYDHPKPWETDRHEPYNGRQFTEMVEKAHELGLAIVPYCSPYYCNAPDLYAEMSRVLSEYKMDGLYFDGWSGYLDDFRPAYEMIRKARELIGNRILYLHTSSEPYQTVRVYPPFVFAYADFCLRGEANRDGLDLDRFLRYAVSGNQISNTVGMWCHYGSMGEDGYHFVVPTTADIDAALRNNVRIWRQTRQWRGFPDELARFDREYYDGLAKMKTAATR
jgi:hypothetical protein